MGVRFSGKFTPVGLHFPYRWHRAGRATTARRAQEHATLLQRESVYALRHQCRAAVRRRGTDKAFSIEKSLTLDEPLFLEYLLLLPDRALLRPPLFPLQALFVRCQLRYTNTRTHPTVH